MARHNRSHPCITTFAILSSTATHVVVCVLAWTETSIEHVRNGLVLVSMNLVSLYSIQGIDGTFPIVGMSASCIRNAVQLPVSKVVEILLIVASSIVSSSV
jgi:hypothetical protein